MAYLQPASNLGSKPQNPKTPKPHQLKELCEYYSVQWKGICNFCLFLEGKLFFCSSCSLRGDAKIIPRSELLFGQSTEEVDFILVRSFPLVVTLKGALEVSLDVHIERLRL